MEWVGGPSRPLWIELCQKAGTDPFAVLNGHMDRAMKHVREASTTDPKVRLVCLSVHDAPMQPCRLGGLCRGE